MWAIPCRAPGVAPSKAKPRWVLLLDATESPLGWIDGSELTADGTLGAELVDASSPLVHLETTLRDALAMLLASAVQTAVVVDERGRYHGHADASTRSGMRSAPSPSPKPVRCRMRPANR